MYNFNNSLGIYLKLKKNLIVNSLNNNKFS